MNNPKYLIDTNIFLRFQSGQQYDKDCFPTQYQNFIKLLKEGTAVSIDKVKNELDDEIFCKDHEYCFKDSIDNEISDTYNTLRSKYPDYFNNYALESPDDADPYIITYAYHNNLCIVTQDEYQSTATRQSNINKYHIPNLCESLGGTCIDNKDKKENIETYTSGFGCICFTELIRIEKLME
ncbi:MAG: DUF4411 family protein [Methanosphaera sp.]|nr:DUF4411 family protein [Methanosphaera sp.]